MSRRAVALLVLAAAVPLAGCGIPPTDPISFGEPPKAAPTGEQLYFLLHNKLYPTLRRDEEPSPAGQTEALPAGRPAPVDDRAADAVNLLAAGPLPADRDAGLTTEVPVSVFAFGSTRRAGDDRHLELFLRADPSGLSDLAMTQIACTATTAASSASDPVERVTLRTRRGGSDRGPVTCPLRPPSPRDP
jgi:hypothetical protein